MPDRIINQVCMGMMWHKAIFKVGLNSKFPFYKSGCLTKAKEPRLSEYLRLADRRTGTFMDYLN